MARQNVFEWTDVLAFGSTESVGFSYSWNQLHDILVSDEFPPMYEAYTRDYCIGEFEFDEEAALDGYAQYSKATCEVVTAFMKEEGITEMLITR